MDHKSRAALRALGREGGVTMDDAASPAAARRTRAQSWKNICGRPRRQSLRV